MSSSKPFNPEDAAANFEAMLERMAQKPASDHSGAPSTGIETAETAASITSASQISESERLDADPKAQNTGTPKPHYHSHRQRMTDKFDRRGAEAFDDYELLELILFRSRPRIDTKPMAKALIKRFGNLAEVVAAPVERLIEVENVGPATARDLKLLHQISVRIGQKSVLNRPVLSSWTALLDYCRAAMQFEGREQFRVLFLDKKNRLLADEIMGHGTVDRAPVYPREIVRRALHHEATAVILAHNHPSGDPTPSPQDVTLTNTIVDTLGSVSVTVHDHLIIGRDDITSFKMLGLL